MTPEQFCYWLQGKTEDRATLPDEAEWASIKEHLQKVFTFLPVRPTPYTHPLDTPDLSPKCLVPTKKRQFETRPEREKRLCRDGNAGSGRIYC